MKETMCIIDCNDLDNPFLRESIEELPNEILAELLIRNLKRIKKSYDILNGMKQMQILTGGRNKTNIEKVLNILGGKDG